MDCSIRPVREEDSGEISAVILRALRETNARDYTDEIIERLEHSFSPAAVLGLQTHGSRRRRRQPRRWNGEP